MDTSISHHSTQLLWGSLLPIEEIIAKDAIGNCKVLNEIIENRKKWKLIKNKMNADVQQLRRK